MILLVMHSLMTFSRAPRLSSNYYILKKKPGVFLLIKLLVNPSNRPDYKGRVCALLEEMTIFVPEDNVGTGNPIYSDTCTCIGQKN